MPVQSHDFFEAKVAKIRPNGTRFQLVSFTVKNSFAFSAGQYCIVSLNEQKTYLAIVSAIASAPPASGSNEAQIEPQAEQMVDFLVDNSNSLLPKFRENHTFQISAPQGVGFPAEKRKNRYVYIITHGSGISAFTKVIDEFLEKPADFQSLTLVYGIAREEQLPFAEDFNDWQKRGLVVQIAYSQEKNRCRVQALLEKINFSDVEQSVVLLVGNKEMSADVKKICLAKGFQENQILFNF